MSNINLGLFCFYKYNSGTLTSLFLYQGELIVCFCVCVWLLPVGASSYKLLMVSVDDTDFIKQDG